VRQSPLVLRLKVGLLYQPLMTHEYEAFDGMIIGRRTLKFSEKACPSATSSTINPA
jgi:hypothetical protein